MKTSFESLKKRTYSRQNEDENTQLLRGGVWYSSAYIIVCVQVQRGQLWETENSANILSNSIVLKMNFRSLEMWNKMHCYLLWAYAIFIVTTSVLGYSARVRSWAKIYTFNQTDYMSSDWALMPFFHGTIALFWDLLSSIYSFHKNSVFSFWLIFFFVYEQRNDEFRSSVKLLYKMILFTLCFVTWKHTKIQKHINVMHTQTHTQRETLWNTANNYVCAVLTTGWL